MIAATWVLFFLAGNLGSVIPSRHKHHSWTVWKGDATKYSVLFVEKTALLDRNRYHSGYSDKSLATPLPSDTFAIAQIRKLDLPPKRASSSQYARASEMANAIRVTADGDGDSSDSVRPGLDSARCVRVGHGCEHVVVLTRCRAGRDADAATSWALAEAKMDMVAVEGEGVAATATGDLGWEGTGYGRELDPRQKGRDWSTTAHPGTSGFF
jgi:hypothetical protein